MARQTEEPVYTLVENNRTRITHPAFGQISASRVSGNTNLYGSDFNHHNYITITLSRSEVDRHLSNDWHYAKNEMFEVALSEAQWATFVSSLNIGGGVPCTIQHTLAASPGYTPALPNAPDRREQFAGEIAENMVEAQKALEELEILIMDSKLSGAAQKAMRDKLRMASREIGSSTKFVADQFDQHMETSVEKAKIEVNAYATRAIMAAGLDRLGVAPPVVMGIGHDDEDL